MAETWPDGEVTLRFEAFGTALDRNSAAVLAAVLAHEAVHFDQLVGPGWKSFGIDEAPAYEAELATAQRLGLPRSWTQSTESGMKAAKAQAFKERLFGGPSPFRSPEAEAAIKREFEAVADARQERDDRIYRLRAELADQRKWMAGLKKRWHYADLENIAFNACA